jgi:hypothetical protein
MGMEPPRQTEIRLLLPGRGLKQQMKAALAAYGMFGFAPPPAEVREQLLSVSSYRSAQPRLGLSITLASDDCFVKLSLLQFDPSPRCILAMCNELPPGAFRGLLALERSLGCPLTRLEYQFLHERYAYNVYPAGYGLQAAWVLAPERPR